MYSLSEIEDMFKFHPPKDESVSQAHGNVRAACVQAARWIFDNTPESHERDKAIDHLREAMFWANSAIACNQVNRG